MKIIPGGVTSPIGFLANGIACGLKRSGRLDLALIYSVVKAKSFGLFTKNKIQAAPVKLSKKHLKNGFSYAIIANSGNANCFTGSKGFKAAVSMSEVIAKNLSIDDDQVLVASTGIIGKQLPVSKITQKASELVSGLSKDNNLLAAKAIMTTDTKPKEVAATVNIHGSKVTIGAMAKGVGMIAPDLATMLCFITTDAAIDKIALKQALKEAVEVSFNSISIDGEMSTNDSVFVLANGLALNKEIKLNTKEYHVFLDALKYICLTLSRLILKDAEGATKFIEITVSKARTFEDAKKIAFRIANSVLFKTAVFGQNPNFGRIIQAAGETLVDIKEEKIKLNLSDLKKSDVKVELSLGLGKHSKTVYTCDLSKKYVDINAGYN
jgi:glutamate N-acetyltransferase/amino-acid N-acetyltransferase